MADDIENINNEVGRLIRARRTDRGMTQEELAKACDWNRSKITEIERGWAYRNTPNGGKKKVPYIPSDKDILEIAQNLAIDPTPILDAAGYNSNNYSNMMRLEHADFIDLTPQQMHIVRAVLKAIREARHDPTNT